MPTTHDSSPSRSRKPIERTSAPMSSPIARIAASPALPGSIVTTRKMAAVVRGASTFCASGAVLSAGGCMIDRHYRDLIAAVSLRLRSHPNGTWSPCLREESSV